ncbi:MAG: WD40/YVTN/BNR-like repeat-containing protein [Actinomycetota bacterium]
MNPRSHTPYLRSAALLLALLTLAGLRVFGSALGGLDELRGLSGRARGPEAELEGAMSPAGDWMVAQRANGSSVVAPHAYQRAMEQTAALQAETLEVDPELADAPWALMGPTNIGGRVSDVGVSVLKGITNPPVFASTASGGVWVSFDFGTTWEYRWDPSLTQATGAIAVDGTTVYAGTGEVSPGGGSVTWGGTGMYRSLNAGQTWQHIGLPTSGAIGRIAIDPKDRNRVFVAAAGNLFVPGGERGLYRTTNAGETWEQVLAGENDTTGATDVSIDPVDPKNVLAATWDHQRLPTHRRYAGPGSGVFLSKDGGTTWTKATLPGAPAPEQLGRIGVAFAPSDPTRAYAVIANNLAGGAVGVWRSDDGGATWTKTPATAGSLSQSSFGWWFGRIFVDPADKEHVFVPGVSLVESTNGGNSFSGISGPHADQHGMAWDPSVDGRVYLGNDGGMYRSDANGRNGSWIPAAEQGWTQHYSVDVSEQNPNHVVSGLQDNGCNRNYAAGNVGHAFAWHQFSLCGDGLQTLINPVDEGVTYACSQYGSCSRGTAGGIAAQGIGGTTGRKGWWVPLQFDPSNPSVMYYGSSMLFRSTNGGANWTPISEDLTTDPEQLDPNNGYKIYGTITTVAAAKSDGSVIYVGTDDGLLWRTTDLGQNWTRLEDPDDPSTPVNENDLPGSWVTRVAVDPADANVAYATFSGFRSGDATPHVVRTTDGGASWTNISGNLPSAPVNDVIVIPGGKLAVATDTGVFLTSDGGETWLAVGSGLPMVPILDIRYHQGTNTITAATFGHGIQRVALS